MKKPVQFVVVLLIILGIIYVAYSKTRSKSPVVPKLPNYTTTEVCPDGISPKTEVSGDGKSVINLECPKEKALKPSIPYVPTDEIQEWGEDPKMK